MKARILPPFLALLFVFVAAWPGATQQRQQSVIPMPAGPPPPPAASAEDAIYFGIIGDYGTGSRRQRETGAMMEKVRVERFPFTFVLTTGDNIYGGQDPSDMQRKFVVPYKALIDAGITFHASLGNHDSAGQTVYELFNMGGKRYYTFTRGPVQFFALDSSQMTPEQLKWFEEELQNSSAKWKITYLHHPLYSSGMRHGPLLPLRNAIEPLLVKHGVQVLFAGHEHFYERYSPQNGVQHFTTGAAGQLRLKNIRFTKDTAAGYDTDNSFMVARIAGEEMYFESISRRGWIVDSGIVNRLGGTKTVSPTGQQQVQQQRQQQQWQH